MPEAMNHVAHILVRCTRLAQDKFFACSDSTIQGLMYRVLDYWFQLLQHPSRFYFLPNSCSGHMDGLMVGTNDLTNYDYQHPTRIEFRPDNC